MVHPIKQFEHLKITLEAIISATNNFADENCIGRGGFGKVYKGEIDNTMVALKRLDPLEKLLAMHAGKYATGDEIFLAIKKGKLTQILDSDIRDQLCPQSLKEFVRTAKACVHRDPKQRPTMAEALGSLEAALTLQEKFNNSLQPTPTPTPTPSRRTIMDRIFGGNVKNLP
ncbi:receptor-like protein kinase FERONIA [Tanacetum coccineum]